MRKTLLLLLPLLLAGCVRQSASYYVDEQRVRAITVRGEQPYFWNDAVNLLLVVSNMPECQRRFPLGDRRVADVAVELFSAGNGVFIVRAGSEVWQVEVQNCTQMAAPKLDAMGVPVAVFRLGKGDKMDLEILKPATSMTTAPPT